MPVYTPPLERMVTMSIPRHRPTPLAQWLENAMTAKGWSQRRLAEEAEVSQPRITQILGGGGTRPETLRSLVAALFMGDPNSDAEEYAVFEAEAIRAAWPTPTDDQDWLDELSREAGFDNSEAAFSDEEREQIKDGLKDIARAYIEAERRRRRR